MKNIVNEIIREFELGELSFQEPKSIWNDFTILVNKLSFYKDGTDGYRIKIQSEQNKDIDVLYDSWSRVFVTDSKVM